MIDRYTAQRILDTAQIVEVVQDFVNLKRAGANYRGLCPFHDDSTPSFMVSPAKNLCKCFACGEGGTPVRFIMKHENLSYPDALRYLAKKYNIEIVEKEQTDEERHQQSVRESLFALNDFALKWFENQLYDTVDGRAVGMPYFRFRGFRDDILRKFRVGFSPSERDALCHDAIAAGYNKDYLLQTGLVFEPQGSTKHQLIDRFHGRVIFPIFNISGRVCGFGGRVLDTATKGVNIKYQNSPESEIYSKRRELYGLFQARQAISKNDQCFLVEGYTDVMAMHQMGIENVVASSGTALTTQQISLIHRLTSNIILVYDGDEAGIKASERGVDLLLQAGMNVKLLLLPDGDDPDSFSRKCNAKKYQEYMKTHQVDFIEYRVGHLINQASGDPIKLSRLTNTIVDSISLIPDQITCSAYIRKTSQLMQVDEAIIANAVGKKIRENRNRLRIERDNAIREKVQREDAGLTGVVEGQSDNDAEQTTVTKEPLGMVVTDSLSKTEPAEDYEAAMGALYSEQQNETLIKLSDDGVSIAERDIIKMLIQYANKDVCLIEDQNGEERAVNVVEYIATSLEMDKIVLRNPLYARILEMAKTNLNNEEFANDSFFINNPDPEIATLAFELTSADEPLSNYHTRSQHVRSNEERLYEIVPQTMASYKLILVRNELKQKKLMLQSNKENCAALMQDISNLTKIQASLAKECGDRVLL